jgi:hypothetical protein
LLQAVGVESTIQNFDAADGKFGNGYRTDIEVLFEKIFRSATFKNQLREAVVLG